MSNSAPHKRNLAVPFLSQRENTYQWEEHHGKTAKDEAGNSLYKQKKAGVAPISMAWRSCNITCVCMVLRYYGLTTETPDQMMDKFYKEIGGLYESNNEEKNEGASKIQLWKELHDFVKLYEAHGITQVAVKNLSLAEIQAEIAAGYPVIVSCGLASNKSGLVTQKTGHIIVIRGFTENNDLIVNDPFGHALSLSGTLNATSDALPGFYFENAAAGTGDNVVFPLAEFQKVYSATESNSLVIHGPLWNFPVENLSPAESGDCAAMYARENCPDESFPIKANNLWHNGIHIESGAGFCSIGAGRILAIRNNYTEQPATGSNSFILMEYTSRQAAEQNKLHRFYALYMHIKPLEIEKELENYIRTGNSSTPIGWLNQLFEMLFPVYKIMGTEPNDKIGSMPESSAVYTPIYQATINENYEVSKTETKVGTMGRRIKINILPANRPALIERMCKIESYKTPDFLDQMLKIDESVFCKDNMYYFHWGKGNETKLCCCSKNNFDPRSINDMRYRYYAKKIYELSQNKVVSFNDVEMSLQKQTTENFSKLVEEDKKRFLIEKNKTYLELVREKYLFCRYDRGMVLNTYTGNLLHILHECFDYATVGAQACAQIKKLLTQMEVTYVKARVESFRQYIQKVSEFVTEQNKGKTVSEADRKSLKSSKEWLMEKCNEIQTVLASTFEFKSENFTSNISYVDNVKKLLNIFTAIANSQCEGITETGIEYLGIYLVKIPQHLIRDTPFLVKENTLTALIEGYKKALENTIGYYTSRVNESYRENYLEIPRKGKLCYGAGIFNVQKKKIVENTIHFEIFSDEKILDSNEITALTDTDKNLFYSPRHITEVLIEKGIIPDDKKFFSYVQDQVITKDEIMNYYTHAEKFKNIITQHISEWADLDVSSDSLSEMLSVKITYDMKGSQQVEQELKEYIENEYKPFIWFTSDIFPKNTFKNQLAWFYHPIRFLELISP